MVWSVCRRHGPGGEFSSPLPIQVGCADRPAQTSSSAGGGGFSVSSLPRASRLLAPGLRMPRIRPMSVDSRLRTEAILGVLFLAFPGFGLNSTLGEGDPCCPSLTGGIRPPVSPLAQDRIGAGRGDDDICTRHRPAGGNEPFLHCPRIMADMCPSHRQRRHLNTQLSPAGNPIGGLVPVLVRRFRMCRPRSVGVPIALRLTRRRYQASVCIVVRWTRIPSTRFIVRTLTVHTLRSRSITVSL